MDLRHWLVCGLFLVPLSARAADRVDYLRDIKPILAEKCYACHGSLKQASSLRLDTVALIRKGGRHGPAILPGKSSESLLIAKVTEADGETLMPPEGEGERLSAAQIALLKAWIDQGAPAPDEPVPPDPREHWAYRPPVRRPLPPASGDWAHNPIDAFLASEHARLGLTPVGLADRHVLVRRLFLDLIGLPPTPQELDQALADNSADWYEKLVDRLLASPHHGERWGRHWMDVWRYSDWSGYGNEIRNSQRHIWRWRDWIIDSLNQDKGYDRMILEMLAGDELAPDDSDTLRATGFLARNWYKFNRHAWLDQTVEHTAKAFLGLTMNCAKCHDHKYDPIPQLSYYQMRAIFEPHDIRIDPVPGELDPTKDGLPRAYDAVPAAPTYLLARGDERKPLKDRTISPGLPAVLGGEFEIRPVPLPLTAYYPNLQEHVLAQLRQRARADLDSAQKALDKAKVDSASASPAARQPADGAVRLAELRHRSAESAAAALEARIAADLARHATPPDPRADELAREAAKAERQLAVHQAEAAVCQAELALAQQAERSADAKGKEALARLEKELADARKKLADAQAALARPEPRYTPLGKDYPRTSTGRRLALARWIVGRHNPLTARVAVNHVWLRHFGAPLVDEVFDFGLRCPPPRHQALLDWLAVEFMERGWSLKHLHRLIVTSRAYRLASSDRDAAVSRARDPDNHYLWRMNSRRLEAELVRDSVLHVAGNLDTTRGGPDLDHNLSSRRRSLYFRHAYEKKMVFLELFDAASENECYRRSTSIVPQQALALANSTLSLEQSRLLARRLAAETAAAAEPELAFVEAAFVRVLGRPPTADERDLCRTFLAEQSARLAAAATLTAAGSNQASQVPPASDPRLRARENLVHVLMNHNDFVTIR